jgi:hypothetical protein
VNVDLQSGSGWGIEGKSIGGKLREYGLAILKWSCR